MATILRGDDNLDSSKVLSEEFAGSIVADSAGRVTMPHQPVWSVLSVLSNGDTPSASGAFGSGYSINETVHGIQGVVLSGADVSNLLRVTVPVAGWYFFGMKRHQFTNASSQWTEFRLNVNGITISSGHQGHVAGAYQTVTHTTVAYLNANDYIEYSDNGGTQFQLHGPSNAFGYLIG